MPDGPRRRVMLAAFGDAGHAFPAIALGRELVRRGHKVCLETWARWREDVGRDGLNGARARVGLPPLDYLHNGISRELALVATFPQLEYPRPVGPWVEVTGPLMWEQPFGEVDLPPGEDPLVLVAPSTSQDPR